MRKSIVLLVMGMLVAFSTQARNKQYTRKATPEDPTFDLVISYWDTPDADKKVKIEAIIRYAADALYEATEGAHRLKNVYIYLNEKESTNCYIQCAFV